MNPVLYHERVSAEGRAPARWLYMLPGIYGAGRNWGSVARGLVARRPDWGVLLVDLRQHGGSQGFAPPHTIAAAADDLRVLGQHAAEPTALLGHSFGGKVALEFLRRAPGSLEQVWVIDSTPSARPPGGSAWQMLRTLRELPARYDAREDAVRALVDRGVEEPVARWMTTNLERAEEGFRWRFEPDAMEELLRDFFRADLWPALEPPPDGTEVHFVKADQSGILTDADTGRARAADRVHFHTVASGHWVNADNPEALLDLLERELPRD